MSMGLLNDGITFHKHQIEVLTKELQEREEAGQRRIARLCKEHSDALAVIIESIEKHQQRIRELEHTLTDAYHMT